MLTIPTDLARAYESLLANHSVPAPQWPYYLKWLRYYLEFCQKYEKYGVKHDYFPREPSAHGEKAMGVTPS